MNVAPVFTSSFELCEGNLYLFTYTTSTRHYPDAVVAEEKVREVLVFVVARLPHPPFLIRRVVLRNLPRGRFTAEIFVESAHELVYPGREVLSLLEPYRW